MPLDFARLIALKRGVAHSAIFVFKRHRKEPESKQRQRIRHVIARDAFPVFRFDSRKFPVFLKARYVNDVHLIPLRPPTPTFKSHNSDLNYENSSIFAHGLIRNHRPQSDAPRAIQRMSPLQTFDSIARRIVMRQLPHSLEARFILPLCNHLGRGSRPDQTSFLIQLSTRFSSSS